MAQKKTKISENRAEKKRLQMQPGLIFYLMQLKNKNILIYMFWSHCAGPHAQCDSTEINTGIFSSIPMCFPLNDSVAGLCSSF